VPAEVRVLGLSELLRAAREAGKATNVEVREALRKSGEIVQADAAPRLAKYSTTSAAGLKVRVRQRGVGVEQSLRKTTGTRSDYGKLQMRNLLQAVAKTEPAWMAEFDQALDTIVEIFEK
jgi:hypothetical protein